VLRTYGDEKFANKIARAVVSERENQPFSESQELVDLLYRVIPAAARRTGGHPAKRTFQALRVEVNQELESLKAALPAVIELLAVGGRAVFMSYQSQEDKIVKRVFADYCASHTPWIFPSNCQTTNQNSDWYDGVPKKLQQKNEHRIRVPLR